MGRSSKMISGLYHRTPDDVLKTRRQDYRLVGAALEEMAPHFEACETGIQHIIHASSAAAGVIEAAQKHPDQRVEVSRDSAVVPVRVELIRRSLRQSSPMTRTFIPRALRASCKLIPNARARRLTRAGLEVGRTP